MPLYAVNAVEKENEFQFSPHFSSFTCFHPLIASCNVWEGHVRSLLTTHCWFLSSSYSCLCMFSVQQTCPDCTLLLALELCFVPVFVTVGFSGVVFGTTVLRLMAVACTGPTADSPPLSSLWRHLPARLAPLPHSLGDAAPFFPQASSLWRNVSHKAMKVPFV